MRNYIPLILLFCCVTADHLFDNNNDLQCVESFIGALIGGIGSLVSTGISAITGNARKKKAERQMNERKRSLDAWRNTEIGANYLDRADSRAAMRRVMDYNTDVQRASNTNAIKQGLTDEAKVAQASRLNRGYADVVGQIAGAGQRHKDAVQQQYLGAAMDLENLKIQNLMDTSGADNMASGISAAANTLGAIADKGNWGSKK